MKRKIDPTLLELWLGILAYGVVFEIALLVFSGNPSYSIGLWIGVFLAAAGAFHMWWSLDRGLDLPEKEAVKSLGAQNIIRYVVLVIVLGVLMYTNLANPILAFCGYMGMKASAYLNPLIHRLRAGKKEQEISDGTAL
ncbi:MAG: hypothetical protein HFI56_01290 [Lachnospiraceae bacterium]|jgi:hypothetical protein|nr:hypothetical protein [Lachnospiraceae bacterium]MCI9396735.1 hypothetical protein [Lachnospiraceae bacterium]